MYICTRIYGRAYARPGFSRCSDMEKLLEAWRQRLERYRGLYLELMGGARAWRKAIICFCLLYRTAQGLFTQIPYAHGQRANLSQVGPLRAWAGGHHGAVAKKARHKSGVVAEGDKSEYARAVDNHNLSLHKTSCDWTTSPVSQSRVLRKKIVNRQAKEIVSESKACLVLETRTRKDTQMHMCTRTHTRFKGNLLHMHMISASLCGHAAAAVLVGFRQGCRRGRWQARTRQAACTPEV